MPPWTSILNWAKFALLILIIAWVGLVWQATPSAYVEPQQEDVGVKAAAFAIAAAVSLFIPFFRTTWLPNPAPDPSSQIVDNLARLVGAIAALLAGWYWLDSSIAGAMAPFLAPLTIAVSLLTVAALAAPVISAFREWIRNRDGRRNG